MPTVPAARRRATPVAEFLRVEAVGGTLVMAAAALALVCANTPLSGAYDTVRTARVPLLDLDVAGFAAEALLSVFFFVAGLELKRELLAGELRERRHAVLPVFAAVCGMAVPALVFLAIAHGTPGAGRGWSVPVATDIAFALGALSVAGARAPGSLRAVLLSLAVVDDVGSIVLIAVLFASGVTAPPLAGAVAVLALYAALQRRGMTTPYVHVPLAVAAWLLVHAGGIHPTVAALVLALLTPVARIDRLERALQPWSAGLVVPVFAFTAAGLPLSASLLHGALTDRAAVAVFVARIAGKPAGIAGGVVIAEHLRIAERPDTVTPYDTLCLGALGGVGFTVSLLLADLAYDGVAATHVKTALLLATVVAGVMSSALLRARR